MLFLNPISYNIVFLLSGGGTLNYFGAKGFIDQELEGTIEPWIYGMPWYNHGPMLFPWYMDLWCNHGRTIPRYRSSILAVLRKNSTVPRIVI